MRISSKGRYGLAAMTYIAQNSEPNEWTTVLNVSEKLGISKIYLEQVFSMLRRAGLVVSNKGASGGYQLKTSKHQITAYDVLVAVETSLFDKVETSVIENAPSIELAMEKLVWEKLDATIINTLKSVTLAQLADEAQGGNNVMFFI